jgi:hypothetical protein
VPYRIETDNPGCRRGYAVVKTTDGEIMGCHATRRAARAQLAALNIAEAEYRALPDNYRPALSPDVPEGRACGNCAYYDESDIVEREGELYAYCRLWQEYVDGGYYCNRWLADPDTRAEERQEGYAPTDGMVAEARRGLEWRRAFGRGGTAVGVARARDIVNRRRMSRSVVARMASFFARHAVDKRAQGFRPGEPGYPSAGRIAWALWGGDPGVAFSRSILAMSRSLHDDDPSASIVDDRTLG